MNVLRRVSPGGGNTQSLEIRITESIMKSNVMSKIQNISNKVDTNDTKSKRSAFPQIVEVCKEFWKDYGSKIKVGKNTLKKEEIDIKLFKKVNPFHRDGYKQLVDAYLMTDSDYINVIKNYIQSKALIQEPMLESTLKASGPILIKIFQKLEDKAILEFVQKEIIGFSADEEKLVKDHVSSKNIDFVRKPGTSSKVASLSIVQFGTNKDETQELVLKILRPRSIFFFICEVLFINSLMETGTLPSSSAVFILEEIVSVSKELDFEYESNMGDLAQDMFGTINGIRVPKVIGFDVAPVPLIWMERAPGVNMTLIEQGALKKEQIKTFLALTGKLLMVNVLLTLERLRYHSDLHGGNVVFDPEKEELWVIDFGSITSLNPKDLRFFLRVSLFIMDAFMKSAKINAPSGFSYGWILKVMHLPDPEMQLADEIHFACDVSRGKNDVNYNQFLNQIRNIYKSVKPRNKTLGFNEMFNDMYLSTGILQPILDIITKRLSDSNSICLYSTLNNFLKSIGHITVLMINVSFKHLGTYSSMEHYIQEGVKDLQSDHPDKFSTFQIQKNLLKCILPLRIKEVPYFKKSIHLFVTDLLTDIIKDIKFFRSSKNLNASDRKKLLMMHVGLTGVRMIGFQHWIVDIMGQKTTNVAGWIELILDTTILIGKCWVRFKSHPMTTDVQKRDAWKALKKDIAWTTIVNLFVKVPIMYFSE